MSVASGDKKSVTLFPNSVIMKQSLDMTLFSITDYILANASDPEDGIRMTITMKRKILSEMMTTYFPSFLLMLITYATTFFKPFFFEAALSVNLTTMLVMTTIFISKMEGLPPTSNIKMIDIWLILCQMVPFAQVVLLTAMEYLREEEQEKEDDKEGTEETVSEEEYRPETEENMEQKKKSKVAYAPLLVTVGKFHLLQELAHLIIYLILLEKRVVPLAVLVAFIIYFVIAVSFYFE